MVITNKNIIEFKKEKEEYIFQNDYLIHDNWKMKAPSSTNRFFGVFNQYFSSYVLPNNKLLLYSYSTQYGLNRGCKAIPQNKFLNSKFIFIDLTNFVEIESTEIFDIDANYLILEKAIIIKVYDQILIYDINTLLLIKNREFIPDNNYLFKYNNQYLISIFEEDKNNNLIIYELQKYDLIQYCKIKLNFGFHKNSIRNYYYNIKGQINNKLIFILKDKRIILLCQNKIYLIKIIII